MRCCILPVRAYVWPPVSYQATNHERGSSTNPARSSLWPLPLREDRWAGEHLFAPVFYLQHAFHIWLIMLIFSQCQDRCSEKYWNHGEHLGGWFFAAIYLIQFIWICYLIYIYIYILYIDYSCVQLLTVKLCFFTMKFTTLKATSHRQIKIWIIGSIWFFYIESLIRLLQLINTINAV